MASKEHKQSLVSLTGTLKQQQQHHHHHHQFLKRKGRKRRRQERRKDDGRRRRKKKEEEEVMVRPVEGEFPPALLVRARRTFALRGRLAARAERREAGLREVGKKVDQHSHIRTKILYCN